MTLLLASLLPATAYADLQNVEIGGEIRIRGRYWRSVYENSPTGPSVIRIPAAFTPKRPIGPLGVSSRYRFDRDGSNMDFTEMRTRINVDADFTQNVRAFIELESYDWWGEDFTSNYITGVDGRSGADVYMYQAYIEASEMWGIPLRSRIGRQEMKMGKGWLVDNITTAIIGRSFDALRLTYERDTFVIDAWASKLAEDGFIEEDGSIDFYGVYGTYTGLDPVDISAYWMLIRDAREIHDSQFVAPIEWIENLFGLDQYDPTYMHTVGLRAFGGVGAFDYDAELAYQFGEADAVGSLFKPSGGFYGDTDAEYGNWAGDAELGYTIDTVWNPRVYLGGAYFGGEDNRDLNLIEFLNPFYRADASVSFNRLFPGKPYSLVLEIGQDMTNFWQVRTGVQAHPTESISAHFKVAYFEALEEFDLPPTVNIGGFKVPIAPAASWWTTPASDEIGWTTALFLNYAYSEDLSFGFIWEHLFPGDGLVDGNFMHQYGLEFSGGSDDDGSDYFHLEARIDF
jgi:hypothetical protein